MKSVALLDRIKVNLDEIEERIDSNLEDRSKAIEYFLSCIRGNIESILVNSNNFRRNEWFNSIFDLDKGSEIYGRVYVSMHNLEKNLKKLVFSLYANDEFIEEAKSVSEKLACDLGLSYSRYSVVNKLKKSIGSKPTAVNLEKRIDEVLDNDSLSLSREIRNKTSHVGTNNLLNNKGKAFRLYISPPNSLKAERARKVLDKEIAKYLNLTNECLEKIVGDSESLGLTQRKMKHIKRNNEQVNEQKYFRGICRTVSGIFLFGVISLGSYGIDKLNTSIRYADEDSLFKELVGIAYSESAGISGEGNAEKKFANLKLRLMNRQNDIDSLDDGVNSVLDRWEISRDYDKQ
ncbi:MAG: hypothetical protein KC550_07435, partial [Nanoarchaeota archaeon]|nr:hypothetical protein [Nanoarchaeota archaeon]